MSVSIKRKFPDGREENRTELSYRAVVTRSLYVPIVIGIMILGGLFGSMSVMLGAKGNTHLTLFGQSLETTDVGVASLFIGAVTVIMVIRRVLKGAEKISDDPGRASGSKSTPA